MFGLQGDMTRWKCSRRVKIKASDAYLFFSFLIEMILDVDVSERHAKVWINVSGAPFPPWRFFLEAENFLRKLKSKITKLLERQRGHGRINAPPYETSCEFVIELDFFFISEYEIKLAIVCWSSFAFSTLNFQVLRIICSRPIRKDSSRPRVWPRLIANTPSSPQFIN